MRFLYFYGDSRKAAEAEATEVSIMMKFRQLFNVSISDQFLIQEYSPMFSEYLDVEDFTSLSDLTKLRFVLKTQPIVAPVNNVVNRNAENAEQIRGEEAENGVEEEDEEDGDHGHSQGSRLLCGGKEVPYDYQLPKFDPKVARALSAKVPLSPSLSALMIRNIFDQLVREYVLDMCPTKAEYGRVVDALMRDHPHLRDRVNIAEVNRGGPLAGDSSRTWRMALRKRFKNARQNRKNEDDGISAHTAHLEEMRKKFCQKKNNNKRQVERPTMTRASTSSNEAGASHYGVGESETTTIEHQRNLDMEWKKNSPNLDLIRVAMDATKIIRKHQLRTLDVNEIKKLYPPLRVKQQWFVEVQRQFGRNFLLNLEQFFSTARIEAGTKALRQIQKSEGMFSAVKAAAGDAAAVLCCLPFIAKETVKSYIIIDEAVTCGDAVVLVTTSENDNFFEGARYAVYVDGQPLTEDDCTSPLEAFALAVAAIHLLNLEYPRAKKCWQVLSEIMCRAPNTRALSLGCQRLINILLFNDVSQ